MILVVLGPEASGKTEYARQMQNTFSNVKVYDDMTIADIQEQSAGITKMATDIGCSIVIVNPKQGPEAHATFNQIILGWKEFHKVTVFRIVPVR